MKKAFCFLFCTLILYSCKDHQEEKSLLLSKLYGDWVPAGFQVISDSAVLSGRIMPVLFGIKVGFSFDSTGVVDLKRPFLKVQEVNGKTRRIYVGSKTKYFLKGDSLKVLDLTDSTWWSSKIARLSNDTLSFNYQEGVLQNFVRKRYYLDTIPTFDKIVVSSSGCYGSCEISNTIINSKGEVTFLGELFTSKTGLLVGTINPETFRELQDNFRKADFKNLKRNYTYGGSDNETITITLLKGDSIYKTISDYGYSSPPELQWAYTSVRYLYQHIRLNTTDKANIPYYPAFHFLTFEKGKNVLQLSQSEGFLLWNLLRRGEITTQAFKEIFALSQDQHNGWASPLEEDNQLPSRNSIKTSRIISDGRYYKFRLKGKQPITIDIGFNFIDRNFKREDFIPKGGS